MNKKIFKQVKDLNFPLGRYALFGSAPMGVRGLRDCNDADVIVLADLFEELRSRGFKENKKDDGSPYFKIKDVEIWKNWAPGDWDINSLIKDAEIIDGLPFVQLHEVLKWKKLLGREKDFSDIKLINNFLKEKTSG